MQEMKANFEASHNYLSDQLSTVEGNTIKILAAQEDPTGHPNLAGRVYVHRQARFHRQAATG